LEVSRLAGEASKSKQVQGVATTMGALMKWISSLTSHFAQGKAGWLTWIIITALVVGAHLVTDGLSAVCFWAIVGIVLLCEPLSTYFVVHTRGFALILGALMAFYILMCVETSLGYVGLYYGPVGSAGRQGHLLDAMLISTLLWFYKIGGYLNASLALGGSMLLYFVLPRYVQDKTVRKLAHVVAGIGMFVSVLLWFPFANALEVNHIGFKRAVFSTSQALATIGDQENAVEKLAAEVKVLRMLETALQSSATDENRKQLFAAVAGFAKAARDMNTEVREHNKILLRPGRVFELRNYLLPMAESEEYPLRIGTDAIRESSTNDGAHGSASEVIAGWMHTARAAELVARGQHLVRERNDVVQNILVLLGRDISESLGSTWDVQISRVVNSQLLPVLARSELNVALQVLAQKTARLDDLVRTAQEDNVRLAQAVEVYRKRLLTAKLSERRCETIMDALLSHFRQETSGSTIRIFAEYWSRTENQLTRVEVRGNEVVRPEPVQDLDTAAVEEEIDNVLAAPQAPGRRVTQADFRTGMRALLGQHEIESLILFVTKACERQRTANDIIAMLNQIAAEVQMQGNR
jgi:hypothetical protein